MNWGINKILNWLTKGHVSKFFKKEHCKHDLPVAFVAGKIFVLFLLLLISNITVAQTWDCDCDNRKEITLNNSTGTALTNYQIRIDVSYETAMNTDFSNLKFTTSNDTDIYHWVETYTASTSAVVWVKVPAISASATDTIYMYYGGSDCTATTTNASDVFLFYEDFSTWSGWTVYGTGDVEQNTTTFTFPVGAKTTNDDPNGRWKSIGTTIDDFRLITREQRPNTTAGNSGGALNRYGIENSDFDGYTINRNGKNSGGNVAFGYERRDNGTGGNSIQVNLSQPQGTWFRTELRRCSSTDTNEAELYSDTKISIGAPASGSISGHNYSGFDRITIRGGHDYYLDFMAVAQYSCNEPTVSVGAEEDGIADFSASVTTILTGGSIDFTDNSTDNPTSWAWAFTGGTPATSSAQNPTGIIYNTAGTHNVSLTATNASGCSHTETKTNYITVQDYCQPTYSTGTSGGDYISLVQLGSINNSTGASSSPYYIFYDAFSTNLTIGSSYVITLSAGSYTSKNNISVWIDYNKNGVFEATEKIGNVTLGASPQTETINFTIPSSSIIGSTRMRVREVWNKTNMKSCTEYIYGETEDYTINICKNPDVPTLSFSANPVCEGDTVTLSITGNLNSATQWVIYTGTCGGTLVGTTTSSSYSLNNVTSSTTYYVRGEGSCIVSGSCGSASITVDPLPAITLYQNSAEVCFGDNTAPFGYTIVSGSPDQYSIDFNAAAEAEDFVDVTNAILLGSVINVAVPVTGTPGTYSAELIVNNSSTGCISAVYNITIIINPLPNTGGIIPD